MSAPRRSTSCTGCLAKLRLELAGVGRCRIVRGPRAGRPPVSTSSSRMASSVVTARLRASSASTPTVCAHRAARCGAGCRNTGEPLGGASWRRKPSQLDLSTSGRRSDPQPPRRTRRGSINESAICGQRQGVVEAGAISLLSNLGSDTIDS